MRMLGQGIVQQCRSRAGEADDEHRPADGERLYLGMKAHLPADALLRGERQRETGGRGNSSLRRAIRLALQRIAKRLEPIEILERAFRLRLDPARLLDDAVDGEEIVCYRRFHHVSSGTVTSIAAAARS
jgi:hypothetical protein